MLWATGTLAWTHSPFPIVVCCLLFPKQTMGLEGRMQQLPQHDESGCAEGNA